MNNRLLFFIYFFKSQICQIEKNKQNLFKLYQNNSRLEPFFYNKNNKKIILIFKSICTYKLYF